MSRSFRHSIATSFNGHGLVRAAKNMRSAVMDHAFRARGHAARDRFLDSVDFAGRPVVFTIAFNTPWVIDLLTASWAENVSDAALVVADNSKNREARAEHRRICTERGVPYVELPKNWEWNNTRSHGVSLNWVYYNLIEPLSPSRFGFIDHDCFPTQPVTVESVFGGKQLAGWILRAKKYPDMWYLWPGFCFFDYELTQGRELDFRHGTEWGGDTGVKNWDALYSKLDVSDAREAVSRMVAAPQGWPVERMQVIDGRFNHVGAASYRPDLASAERKGALADFLWAEYMPGRRRMVTP